MERDAKPSRRRAITARQGIVGLLAGVGGVIAYGLVAEALGFDLAGDPGPVQASLLGIGVLVAFAGTALWAAESPATGSRAVHRFRPWIVGALATVGAFLLAAITLASTGAFGATDPGVAERPVPALVILAAGLVGGIWAGRAAR
ncbi:MAG: hypothetical protein QOJ29_3838 [Thermoleophilaceae bacterium]|jgi:hypothetical protein|nr:hypothetical protein [Thermoleophilaceae bacterium]